MNKIYCFYIDFDSVFNGYIIIILWSEIKEVNNGN